MIKLLVGHGADINAKDKFGRTAVLDAARQVNDRNRVKVVDILPFLLQNGAKKEIRDNKGLNALDYARKSGDSKVIGLLSGP